MTKTESRKDVLDGELVFAGTRLLVEHVGGMMNFGEDVDSIREDYPFLTESDINFAYGFWLGRHNK